MALAGGLIESIGEQTDNKLLKSSCEPRIILLHLFQTCLSEAIESTWKVSNNRGRTLDPSVKAHFPENSTRTHGPESFLLPVRELENGGDLTGFDKKTWLKLDNLLLDIATQFNLKKLMDVQSKKIKAKDMFK